jgi:hypothetical protein
VEAVLDAERTASTRAAATVTTRNVTAARARELLAETFPLAEIFVVNVDSGDKLFPS